MDKEVEDFFNERLRQFGPNSFAGKMQQQKLEQHWIEEISQPGIEVFCNMLQLSAALPKTLKQIESELDELEQKQHD